MSNFNETSLNFDPSKFPNNEYSKVKILTSEDVLSTIESFGNKKNTLLTSNQNNTKTANAMNQSVNTLQANLPARKSSSSLRNELNQIDNFTLEKQRHADTKYDSIPKDRTCDTKEQEIVKYGLDNIANVIDKLSNQSNKIFSIITNKIEFNILINDEAIPHILGFLGCEDAYHEKINTRIYKEVKEQLQIIKQLNWINWKNIKAKEYLKILKNIFIQYKNKILHTYSNKDDYEKNLLGKVSFKVCNLEYIFSEININSVNKIAIYKSKSNSDSYLLTMPITNKNSYCCLVIQKNKNKENNSNLITYSLKSGGILNDNEYKSLLNAKTLSDYWINSNLSTTNFVFKNNNMNSNNENELEKQRYDTKKIFTGVKLKCSKKDTKNEIILPSVTDKLLIDKQFNDIINKNDNIIIKEIYNLLINNDKNVIIQKLPLMLVKLYQNSKSNKEDYYKTLLILENEFNQDIVIKRLVNACYTNNITEIEKILNEINKDIDNTKECELFASVSISKVDSNFYLNTLLSIKSDLINIKSNKNIDNETFAKQIINTNNELENIYKQIQSIKLSNIKDAKKYIKLLNDYYNMYEIIQSSIVNLYSYCMKANKNIGINDICKLSDNYPNIFNLLTEIGYDKPIKENNNYLDNLINEIKNNISIINLNDYLCSNKEKSFDNIIDNIFKLDSNYATLLIKLNTLILIKEAIIKLENNTCGQNLSSEEEKLKILLSIKNDYYDNVKYLKMAG